MVQGGRVYKNPHRIMFFRKVGYGKEDSVIVFHLHIIHSQFTETVQSVRIQFSVKASLSHKPFHILLRHKKIRYHKRIIVDVTSPDIQHPRNLIERCKKHSVDTFKKHPLPEP